jgi:hypothetical protein
MSIDEELWKKFHLEDIHNELRANWKRNRSRAWDFGYYAYEMRRRLKSYQEAKKKADKWPHFFWKAYYDVSWYWRYCSLAIDRVKKSQLGYINSELRRNRKVE